MKRIIIIALLYCFGSTAHSSALQTSINRLINQVDPNINLGMEVVDLNTGAVLYQRSATQLFTPASNMKLFSNAAALLTLGPDYRFQNQLSTDASSLDNGVLNGSLYLHLSGDPSFTQRDLDRLLQALSAWGIRQINGNLVIISSHAPVTPYAPGIAAHDLTYGYGAPIAPLMLDENRVTVTINPAYRLNDPATIELDAQSSGLRVANKVSTHQNASKCGVDYKTDATGQLTIQGCVGVGQWAVQQRLAIRNPLSYAETLLTNRLAQLHIQLKGQVLLGTAPTSSLLLASEASKPMSQLMADTLKPSDNLYADSLYLQAAATLQGHPLSWEAAQPVIKTFLQKETGVALETAVLTDGSGLSRNDKLTPEQTVSLLRFLYDRFPLAYEYIAALPVAGQDGTLQRRLRKVTQQGLIRAKTGSMTGVMSLSGYVYTANAHTLAFAVFINTRPGTKPAISGRYRSLVDALCDVLLAERPNNRIFALSPKAHARVAFQQHANQADKLRTQQAKWRRMEFAVKKALHDQPVTVLFKNQQLVLIDHNANSDVVWSLLQALNKQYAFAVALQGTTAPSTALKSPHLLWVKTTEPNGATTRTWTIQESVG